MENWVFRKAEDKPSCSPHPTRERNLKNRKKKKKELFPRHRKARENCSVFP
jgi:hypothetical protein